MARRSRRAGRFDRQSAVLARSSCQPYLSASRQTQPAPKILSQRELPAKTLILLYLIISCSLSCSARQRFRVSLLELKRSRRCAIQPRDIAQALPKKANRMFDQSLNGRQKKVTELLPLCLSSVCVSRPQVKDGAIANHMADADLFPEKTLLGLRRVYVLSFPTVSGCFSSRAARSSTARLTERVCLDSRITF